MNLSAAYLGYGLLFSEVGLALWRRSVRNAGSQGRDAGSLRLLWVVTMSAIGGGVWLALSGVGPRLPWAREMGWIGVAIFAVGTALRWWAIYYLGKFFTVDVAVAADHRVVDTGPYRLVRHPSYTGLLLQFAGMALTLGRASSVAVVLIPIFLALSYRIQVEERALHDGLGGDYAAYAAKTRRLIPWLF